MVSTCGIAELYLFVNWYIKLICISVGGLNNYDTIEFVRTQGDTKEGGVELSDEI